MPRKLLAVLLLFASIASAAPQHPNSPVKVRAITAFVKIDRTNYKTQLAHAYKMLQSAKAAYVNAGYEVQTVRITTQPFPQYVKGLSGADALAFLGGLDKLAKDGGYAFNVGPVTSTDDTSSFELLGQFLAHAQNTNASAIVAGEDGIHWETVRASARLVKYLAENSPHSQGNFSFAATAFLPAYAPFFPGSWHDGPGHRFSVGLESAHVVQEVFAETRYDPAAASTKLKAALAKEAIAAAAIAQSISKTSGWEYLGLDPTPAPLKDASVGAAIEDFLAAKPGEGDAIPSPGIFASGGTFGSSGTMTAAFIITDAVKSVPVKQIGYRGLMLPVMEDARIAQRWSEGRITIDDLLAYSSVCGTGTGLDTIPLPGDVTEEQLTRIIGDVATLSFKWKKPLTARLQPVKGAKAGDMSGFDGPYLTNAVIQKLP